MGTAIRPTTTQRVRGFLAAQGAAPPPWGKLDETYAALYRLMRTRAGDDAFWKPVEGLLRDIVADAAGGNGRPATPQAELLRSWDVEGLVRDLRRALPGACAPAGDHRGFAAALSAPVLGGFLALGLAAAGCDGGGATGADSGPADTDEGGDAGADSETDWSDGCALDTGSALYGIIDGGAGITDQEKADLCACLAAMQPGWQDNLTEMFASCDASVISGALELLVERCESRAGVLTSDPSGDVYDYCVGAPDYKGVSFPS